MGMLRLPNAALMLLPISLMRKKRRQIVIEQTADMLNSNVGLRVSVHFSGVERVMPLARKDSRQPVPPDLFHRSEDAQFVVHHDVMVGRVASFDISQHLLFVDVNQDTALDRFP